MSAATEGATRPGEAGRDELVSFLDETLDSAAYRDYGPNGLQVVGAESVRKVCVAVSASLDVFERAAAAEAQLVLVHHGLLWDGDDRRIGALERRRLETLFRHDLSLVAYHLPLDGHPELGNNARLMALLGIAAHEPFAEHSGRALGRYGTLGEPLTPTGLAARLEGALGVPPLVFPGGREQLLRVGAVSGGAGDDIRRAAALGLDAFVTGEAEENSMYLAAELGIAFIAAGHNATETVGVQAVARLLEQRFGLATEFLAVPNPV